MKELYKIGILFFSLFSSMIYTQEKTAVLVLGTGRCGTSCLSGVLNVLGVDFGNNINVYDSYPHNIKGDYEDTVVEGLVGRLLAYLHMQPNKGKFVCWFDHPDFILVKDAVKYFFSYYKKDCFNFGLKNPLISYLIPVFTVALSELGYNIKLLIVVREPEEVMKSYQVYSQISNVEQYQNIAKRLTSLIVYSQNYETLVLKYTDLLNDLEGTVKKINKFLPWLQSYDQCKEELENFVDKNLKHF